VRWGAEATQIRLIVTPSEEIGEGTPWIVGLSETTMEACGIFSGDIVAVYGGKGRRTLCVAHAGIGDGASLGHVVRTNCDARVGGTVRLALVGEGVATATTVHLSPFADSLAAAGLPRDASSETLVLRCLKPYFGTESIPVLAGDHIECGGVEFKVFDVDTAAGASDDQGGLVGPDTKFRVASGYLQRSDDTRANEVGYDDLGGLDKTLATVRELVETPLKRPEFFAAVGVAPPRGVLLHGAPGCGKTSIARAVAAETGAFFFLINGAEILSKQPGEAEANLRKAFDEARKHAPALVFLDEVDAIAPRGKQGGASSDQRRVVRALGELLDELERDHAHAAVVVLAATNRVDAVDPSLRRYGRLDKEVDVGVPDADARLDVLRVRTRDVALADDVDLEALARDTHGFVGADLAQLCLEAAYECVRGAFPPDSSTRTALLCGYDAVPEGLHVNMADFRAAQDRVNPSALRETAASVPKAAWDDVGGLETVKRELHETVQYPVEHAAKFRQFGLPPSKGVLFYGPPGCGKTLLAQAVAHECGANFVSIKGPELLTMWFGESEANVRSLFEKARASAPCILFFDEIDAIAKQRGGGQGGAGEAGDRVINQILTEIDGVGARKDVFVIGATNRPEVLDPAITRPGRLDTLVYIPLPDEASRKAVFAAALRNSPVDKNVDLDLLAKCTPGFSGADCAEVCKRAARIAIRDAVHAVAAGEAGPRKIEAVHIEAAMATARRSVSDADLAKFQQYANKQQSINEKEGTRNISFEDEA